ncbi:MAG: hypothetical protein GDA36_03985 [Rhodobacteraceae bacterium]|nr:hypothetical protein [Paracoccaceae bacterium]
MTGMPGAVSRLGTVLPGADFVLRTPPIRLCRTQCVPVHPGLDTGTAVVSAASPPETRPQERIGTGRPIPGDGTRACAAFGVWHVSRGYDGMSTACCNGIDA